MWGKKKKPERNKQSLRGCWTVRKDLVTHLCHESPRRRIERKWGEKVLKEIMEKKPKLARDINQQTKLSEAQTE